MERGRTTASRGEGTSTVRPRKALAQHFLVAPGVLRRILQAAELTEGDWVVEVGPGRGALTDALAPRARQVVAVELDAALVEALRDRYGAGGKVRVIQADARTVGLDELVPTGQPYKVVANLPYYAATPIIRRFLESAHKPVLMVVTVQREVAQRMVAEPGEMSLVSLAIQVYAQAKIVAAVPPGAFRPAPEVTSAIVRLEPYAQPLVPERDVAGFFRLARAGFSAPRKQLQGALSHALGLAPRQVGVMLEQAGIDSTRRPATLSIAEWLALYRAYRGRD